jgi:transposase-like protein
MSNRPLSDKLKRQAIEAVEANGNNVSKAARALKVNRATLQARLREAGWNHPGVEKPEKPQPEQLDVVQEHQLKLRVKALEAEKRDLVHRLSHAASEMSAWTAVGSTDLRVPEWIRPKKTKGVQHHATISALLSDTHFDEVVDAAEMGGVNAYNRAIAEVRLKRFFEGTIKLSRNYIAGVKIDGIVGMLGGDILTGEIHPELEQTNEAPCADSVVHWAEQLAAGVHMWREEFGYVHLPCVVGNHDRSKQKKQFKRRVRSSFGWLVYKMLEKEFKDDPKVTFLIPDAPDARFQIYDRWHLLNHGDEFYGGGGVGGNAVPIIRGDLKKQKRFASVGQPYDYSWYGHWHTRRRFGTIGVNGSLIGYNEFAAGCNFDFELPQQSMAINTPERGITIECPIFCHSEAEKKFW